MLSFKAKFEEGPLNRGLNICWVAYELLLQVPYLRITSHYFRTARANHRSSCMWNKPAVKYSHPLSCTDHAETHVHRKLGKLLQYGAQMLLLAYRLYMCLFVGCDTVNWGQTRYRC